MKFARSRHSAVNTILPAAAGSLLGGPLSTTDASAAALVGVGATVNPRAVHWNVVREIVLAWVVTVPAALAAGAAASAVIRAL